MYPIKLLQKYTVRINIRKVLNELKIYEIIISYINFDLNSLFKIVLK